MQRSSIRKSQRGPVVLIVRPHSGERAPGCFAPSAEKAPKPWSANGWYSALFLHSSAPLLRALHALKHAVEQLLPLVTTTRTPAGDAAPIENNPNARRSIA